MGVLRRRRHDQHDQHGHRDAAAEPVYDIVTPTEREAVERDIAVRRRRYFAVMVPCLLLVLFGFFVPAPTPVRVVALVVAAVLPPVAAMVGSSTTRR